MDENRIKYFLTSDEKFLIDVDKISLITFTSYQGKVLYDINGNPQKYPEDENLVIYESSKDILSSYYNVYIDGVASPVQLKYVDGVMLSNIINLQDLVFFNSYTGTPELMDTIDINNINYKLEKYEIPNKVYSKINNIKDLNSSTRISIKNN